MTATLATHPRLDLLLDTRTELAHKPYPSLADLAQPRPLSLIAQAAPDSGVLLDCPSHSSLDPFAAPHLSHRMDYNPESGPPPLPGIFAPAPSSSRPTAAAPPGLSRDQQAGPPGSLSLHSSPPVSYAHQAGLSAPRAMQPYPRLTSPQPAGEAALGGGSGARSPSPTKRSFNFPMADPSERWNSIGQVAGNANRVPTGTSQRKPSLHSGLSTTSTAAEPFLGYNELFSPNGSHLSASEASKGVNAAALSTSDPMNAAFRSGSSGDPRGFSLSSSQEQDLISHRFGLSPGHYASAGRDDVPQMGSNPRSVGHDDFRPTFGAGAAPGMLGMHNPGNLSPRSMMQLQHQHMQMQSQLHHQHQHPSHQPPLGPQQQQLAPSQQQLGPQGAIGNSAGIAPQGGPSEEITTVFIVGFPDDMTEREFANMFLFARGFEASTLKIPAGLGTAGPNGRVPDGSGPLLAGPGGPYHAVNMPGSGVFDMGGNGGSGWDDPLTLGRAGASEAFSSLANMASMPNALGGPGLGAPGAANNASAAAAGKIKQIIGFAKFRTRAEALEARDALNGRKVDAEKGCVLKTEMAKKNLHTKQRPILSAPGFPEGSAGPMHPPPGIGGLGSGAGPSSGATNLPPQLPQFPPGGPFDPRAGPQINGPGGQAGPFTAFSKGAGSVEPFNGHGHFQSNGPSSATGDLLSPQEVFGGPDFFSQHGPAPLRSTAGVSAGLEQQGRPAASSQQVQSHQQQLQSSTSVDKWGGSMGPLDYYGPETSTGPLAAPSRGLQSGPGSNLNTQSGQRHDWPAVGSPPPGLYGPAAVQRPSFQRQGSRGASVGGVGTDQASGSGFGSAPSSANKPEDGARVDTARSSSTPSSADPDTADPLQGSVTARFGSLKMASPSNEDEGVKAPTQAPSPDLPSPTGRNVLGDNHPPVNTLFVGNLPSTASSAVLSQIEDQLRATFSSCRGFRQFSFRLKSNGPMCFVEFEDVHTASKAMSELNGHSLGGAIKNGGIRLSFSKNPLFRMNSNSAMNTAVNGAGAGGNGSSPGSAPTLDSGANAQLSLGAASESLSAARR